jgi:hypothetical protein
MKFILALFVLGILALAGSRRVLFDRHVPLGARLIFLTGTEFIIVGLLLGEQYIDLIDARTLAAIEPFTALCLGWVGLMFGLQFEGRRLRSLPQSFLSISVVQACITMLVVFFTFVLLLGVWGDHQNVVLILPAAAALAAAAACSGQACLAIVQRRFPGADRKLLTLLQYVASMDALPALIVFGITTSLCVGCPGVLGEFWGIPRLVLALCMACLMGLLLYSMAREKTSQSDLLLLILGTCAICGGIANQIGVPVLFLSMVCGIILGNISPLRVRMMDILIKGEKFIYFVLLVIAGAQWEVPSIWFLVLSGVYILARLVGKTVGTYAATRTMSHHVRVPALVGLGLTSQAGMALAIAIDFHHASGGFGNIDDACLHCWHLGF